MSYDVLNLVFVDYGNGVICLAVAPRQVGLMFIVSPICGATVAS